MLLPNLTVLQYRVPYLTVLQIFYKIFEHSLCIELKSIKNLMPNLKRVGILLSVVVNLTYKYHKYLFILVIDNANTSKILEFDANLKFKTVIASVVFKLT